VDNETSRGSDYFVTVWNGLLDDPRHARDMGAAVWTFLRLLDMCSKDTGAIRHTSVTSLSKRYNVPPATVKKHISRLGRNGYISVSRVPWGMKIQILRYRPAASAAPPPDRTGSASCGLPETRGGTNIGTGAGPDLVPPPIVINVSTKQRQNNNILSVRGGTDDIFTPIFEHWQKQPNLIDHTRNGNKKKFREEVARRARKILDSGYGPDDILSAIENYSEARAQGFYKWTLPQFLSRDGGARRFIHGNPLSEFGSLAANISEGW